MAKTVIAPFVDAEIYPVETSAKGTNAFYHYCDEMTQTVSYAACLKKIEDRKGGRLETLYAACSSTIGKCECPAVAMKKEEELAGKAMFFINRVKLNAWIAERDGPVGMAAQQTPFNYRQSKSRLVPPPQASSRPAPVYTPAPAPASAQQNDFAAAINFAMQAAKTASDETPKSAEAPAPAPAKINAPQNNVATAGLTMLELARLRAGK